MKQTGDPPSNRYQPDAAPPEPPIKDPLGELKVILLAPVFLIVAAVLLVYENLRDSLQSD